MLKKALLPAIFLVLAYGFWISSDFKEITAGVAIFLFGMLYMEEGFRAFTGGMLERILKKCTNSLWKSLSFGIVTTTIMQSSSLVSVITISFISAGLITLVAGIGIIFGANIGTTTGAWLIAGLGLKVKISAYAMPMLVFGIILAFQKSKSLKGIGSLLAGLGFLFLGIHYMKEGFEAFRDSFDLASYAIGGYPGLFLFAAIGTLATVIMQSSHATLVLILTALAAQQVTYENALALAIGANIGTTITAIIGSMSANIEGKRLAGAHLIFNIITGVIAIIFISQFMATVDFISRQTGIPSTDYTLKLAVFHTLFNLAGVIVMIPFINPLAGFLNQVFRSPPADVAKPLYLSDAAIDFPDTVIEAVRKETWNLFDNAFELMAHGMNLRQEQILEAKDLRKIIDDDREIIHFDLDAQYENKVKILYGAIVEFISRAQANLPSMFSEDLYRFRQAAGDIVQSVKNIKHLRKNTTVYMVSSNSHIRDEYNRLRYRLASILREIHRLRVLDEAQIELLGLDEFKLDIEHSLSALNSSVNELLREQLITPFMATSLLNDNKYAEDTSWNLLNSAHAMLSSHDTLTAEAEQDVGLDREDIKAMAGTNAA